MNTALRQLYFGDGQFYELSPDDDDFQFDFDDSLFDAAAREILDNGGYTPDYLTTPTGSALINETNRAFTDAISKGLGEQPDPAVAAALRENAFIFSGFKTHAELEQVAQLITDENGNIRPFNEFLNDVQKLNKDYNHTYLRTEYNQAVQAAQMASKWADFERDKDFINLQYRTANDERVRASHRILHGVTLPVDDKFWQQYTPPNGWGCRCTVVAVPKDDADYPVKDVHGSTIDGKEVFPTPAYEIFKTNTAKDKKVFPDKHPYLPKGCGNCNRKENLSHPNAVVWLGYDPNSVQCQVCNACRVIYNNRTNKRLDSQTKQQIRVSATQYPDKHFPLVTQGNDTFREMQIPIDGLKLKVRKTFFTETISKSIRHRNFSRTMDYLTNFDKWMGNATFIRIEPGIHHDCEFIVYEASWDGKTIEFKVMVTNVGNLVYTMRIK